ncbi:MAG: hypothetical protein JSU70_00560 [Phycisphaerales bacterium]|nr:MAG: hypothetical protein JSU70_00560 [Phycisphaerales bacterium]
MLILQLRRAECALADGRLDEAFDLAQRSDVQEHRRGQRLIGRLARAYVKRGRGNLQRKRIQPALADCNKAAKLAGELSDVAELRSDICTAIEEKRLKNQDQSLKVAQARTRIENGWLSVGEKILGQAERDDGGANELLQQVAATRMQIDEAVAKAEEALQRDDVDAAVEIFRAANVAHSQNGKAAELRSRLKRIAVKRIEGSLDEGRIDSALALHERIEPIAAEDGRIKELSLALGYCRRAAESVANARPRAAATLLRKVAVICPSAKWLKTAIGQVQQAAESTEQIAAGPLGLIIEGRQTLDTEPTVTSHARGRRGLDQLPDAKPDPPTCTKNAKTHSPLSEKLLLAIDGVGSFLVLRDARVTVGPVSSSARPTLGLIAQPDLPVITIERTDDDYFARANKTIYVNDAPITEKLLADGDRIALSNRCRLNFSIPNPASTTAVLDFSSARLGRADIRQVILMDRELLIGPAASDHIRAGLLDETVTLFARNGNLFSRGKTRMSADGQIRDSRAPLAVGRRIRIGKISLVLTKLEE